MKIIFSYLFLFNIYALIIPPANAGTPCDFKGISIGDHLSPQQITKILGIEKYTINTSAGGQNDAEFAKKMNRASQVGIMNEAEEEEWAKGPSCDKESCNIPYGLSVGDDPGSIHVGTYISFDKSNKITEIDVSYDAVFWDDVLTLMNTKYGDDWKEDDDSIMVAHYGEKDAESFDRYTIYHKSNGKNPKTGDECTIMATSIDNIFEHTVGPAIRSILMIKIISKNF